MSQTFEDQVLTLVTVNSEIFWHRLPIYVVWAYGLVLAWRRRKRHPRVSLVALVALAGFLLESLGSTLLGTILAAKILDWGWSRDSAESLLKWMDFAETFLVAALWGLVLVAIFGERQTLVSRATTAAEPTTEAERPGDERFFVR